MTEFEKGQAIAWHLSHMSQKAIAKGLNRDRKTIRILIENFEAKKSLLRRVGSGRPRATTKREDRRILLAQKYKWNTSAREIKKD